jgi:hypothetical protein
MKYYPVSRINALEIIQSNFAGEEESKSLRASRNSIQNLRNYKWMENELKSNHQRKVNPIE